MLMTYKYKRGDIMTKYLTEKEIEKCNKVTYAFSELYAMIDIVVVNTKLGSAKLQYLDLYHNFENIHTYKNSDELFTALWHEWLKEQLIVLARNTPLINLCYEDIYENLPEKSKKFIKDKKTYFKNRSNLKTKLNKPNKKHKKTNITKSERRKCQIVANMFSIENTIIQDIGEYGFIMLTYYPPIGFDSSIVFTRSNEMFESVLEEWFLTQLQKIAHRLNINNVDLDDIYDLLPTNAQNTLDHQKNEYIKKAKEQGIC